MASEILLPAVVPATTTSLADVTTALGVPRDVLPDDAMIERAWQQLPRLINEIPPQYRSELHVRMCVAVANGLFDAAINYVWNAAVLRLRDRVRAFGVHLVHHFTGKPFDEKTLVGLRDSGLVDLCLRLNLISEDGFFFLDQCREIRNNYSSAHPAMGDLDDLEVQTFLNRCTKHAMSDTRDPRGVDLSALLSAVRGSRFDDEQTEEWTRRLQATHDPQRETAVGTLHGIYCDPSAQEESRLNAVDICRELAETFTPGTCSVIINRHSNYIAEGEEKRKRASLKFFEELELIGLLPTAEQHSIFSRACSRLVSVHQGWDNFHNEPPFAERLLELSRQAAVPATAQREFVEAVVMCAIGSRYGVSNRAEPAYHAIVRSFSPLEAVHLLDLPKDKPSVIRSRLKSYARCKQRFRALVQLLDAETVRVQIGLRQAA